MSHAELESLRSADSRVVILNVRTPVACSVAAASMRRATDRPIVVIDCDPRPEDSDKLRRRMDSIGVDLVHAPVRPHGEALDWIFSTLEDGVLLLLDSDAEVLDQGVVGRVLARFDDPRTFGAGWTMGPRWLAAGSGAPEGTGFTLEKPYTPFLALRVAHVREALRAGLSFRAKTVYNDFRWSARVSKFLAGRFGTQFGKPSALWSALPQRARASTLPSLRWARAEFHGLRPNFFYYDTASAMYQWLRYHRLYLFAGTHIRYSANEIRHWKGLTSETLHRKELYLARNRPEVAQVESNLRERLAVYGLDWDR